MAALMHCLLQSCLEEENESQERTSYEPPSAARMVRSAQFESTAHGEEHVEESDDDNDCCRSDSENNERPLQRFFWWRTSYASLDPVDGGSETAADTLSRHARVRPTSHGDPPLQRNAPFGMFRRTSSGGSTKEVKPSLLTLSRSPLRTASSFRQSKGIPAIDNGEVVFPGSALQQEMAAHMTGKLEEQGDECVICMEGFDATNPRMPTLCGCGENRTYFHLPCLYQWIEQSQSRDCPTCRKRLRWEEF